MNTKVEVKVYKHHLGKVHTSLVESLRELGQYARDIRYLHSDSECIKTVTVDVNNHIHYLLINHHTPTTKNVRHLALAISRLSVELDRLLGQDYSERNKKEKEKEKKKKYEGCYF